MIKCHLKMYFIYILSKVCHERALEGAPKDKYIQSTHRGAPNVIIIQGHWEECPNRHIIGASKGKYIQSTHRGAPNVIIIQGHGKYDQ